MNYHNKNFSIFNFLNENLKNMEIFNLILTISTLAAVVIPIMFEGNLKKSNYESLKNNQFLNGYKSLTKIGKVFFYVSILVVLGNAVVSQINKYEAIKKAQEEIELKKENTFIHLQEEVKKNLATILYDFDNSSFKSSALKKTFTTVHLDNTYIVKYQEITDERNIINWLMKTSNEIKSSNDILDELINQAKQNITSESNIDSFLDTINNTYNLLVIIYNSIENLKSYKDFKNFELNEKLIYISKQNLKDKLFSVIGIPFTDKLSLDDYKKKHPNAIFKDGNSLK
jgi:hypothetical protein